MREGIRTIDETRHEVRIWTYTDRRRLTRGEETRSGSWGYTYMK
nr:MAG TPA: hypothetical protein [Caudoviricetes sp.]